jgi:hypothetical protein
MADATIQAVQVPPDSTTVISNASSDALKIIDPSALIINLFGYHLNLGTILILGLICVMIYAIWKIQSSSRLDFADMITFDGKKVSLTKFLQLIGGLASTWFIVKTGLNGTLSEGIFGIYLTFIASIEGFAKFMSAKYNYKETSILAAAPSPNQEGAEVQQQLAQAAEQAGLASQNASDVQNLVQDTALDIKRESIANAKTDVKE